ncbi:unnamed protein product [Scytosiphon promiscuus]
MEVGGMAAIRPTWVDNGVGSLAGGIPRLGPQAERSSAWINRDGEVQPPTEREALVVDALADKRLYEQELARTREENAFLQDQVRRLTTELKRHQLRFPRAAAEAAAAFATDPAGSGGEIGGGAEGGETGTGLGRAGLGDAVEELPPWVTSSEVMSPLLSAYDARIQDLEGQITAQRDGMEELAARTHQLVEENEQLREEHTRELDELVQQAGASGGLGGVGAREMVGELNERINILMAENTVMADQTSAMAKELDAVHEEFDEREVQMAALTKALSEAGLGLRTLEGRVPQLEKEKAHAEGELMKAVNAMSEREAALSEVGEKLRVSKEEARRLSVKVTELEAERAGMERQAENDADVTAERVRAAGKRITELQGLVAARGQEADVNGDRARKLQRELDSTRRDAEGMLQVMSGMEKQIADFSSREESTSVLAKESKQKVEDALLLRDQARALEIQSRRELARVLEARKADASGHVREMEEAVLTLRNKFLAQVAARDREIQELAAQATRLRGEAERAGRDRAGMEEVYLSLKQGVERETETLKAKFDELQARCRRSGSVRCRHEAAARELEQIAADADREFQAKEAAFRGREAHLEETLKAREGELDVIRNNLRAATDHSESRQREAKRLAAMLEETREEYARKLEEETLVRKAEAEDAKAQAETLQRSSRRDIDAERRVSEVEASFTKQLRTAQERERLATVAVERRLREEGELAQRLSSRNTDLQGRLAQLAAERNDVAEAAKRGAESNARLEKQLADARRKLSELTTQLSETIGQAETRARDEGRLRSELKRLQITAQRRDRDRGASSAKGRGVGSGFHSARVPSHLGGSTSRMRPLTTPRADQLAGDSGSGMTVVGGGRSYDGGDV